MSNRVGQLALLLAIGASSIVSSRADSLTSKHWAFQPLKDPPVPMVGNPTWSKTPLDRFILAKIEERKTRPAKFADTRTLLRRATYDLIGLPPTPEELDQFLHDNSTNAFAKVVERLLASPHYGEQWGRHWLDVARYADTAGENTDHPLPHAWRYRNWIIEALNGDKPYDEFLREQVAGDLLAASGPPEKFAERIVATGYLAISRRFGHDIDKDMHLTFEDTIDNLGKTVLGLSVGCARCHKHKFDPITLRDYYGLYGVFESTRFAFPGCEAQEQPHDLVALLPSAEVNKLNKPFEAGLAKLNDAVKRIEGELAAKRKPFADTKTTALGSGDLPAGGAQEFSLGNSDLPKTLVTVKRGEMLQLTVLPKANHGADSTLVDLEIIEQGGSNRVWNLTRDLLDDFHERGEGAQHSDSFGHKRVWHFFDLVPGPTLFTEFVRDQHKTPGLQVWHGSADLPSVFVNVNTQVIHFITVTMPPRSFGVHPGPKGPVAVAWESPIDGLVNVRAHIAKIDPGGDGVAWKLEKLPGIGGALTEQKVLALALNEAKKRRDEFAAKKPVIPVAYGVADGKARNAKIHKRGEPTDLGEEVPRKFLDVLGGQQLSATNSSGRLELAYLLTSRTNPLTARVMANRIWQWHFGRGLVPTPNDFGTRGQPPTHPELLDHLASAFINSGWSIKAMHRLIMSSATYQQSSAPEDSSNLYTSFPPRRLTAEELRDTLLALSGELDRTPGLAHPFPAEEKWTFTQHAPFAAEYDTSRRSVYVMQKRNRRTPFFALFDGADPNASTATRDLTTVPTQALYFMNDPFLHGRAEKFAARTVASSSDNGVRLDWACRQLFGREASPTEHSDFPEFFKSYVAACSDQPSERRVALAWSAYARVLLASNELLHLD